MDAVKYKEKEYPVMSIDVPTYGMRMISIESLENEIMTDEFEPIDEEAKAIDEMIFFYVPDEIIDDEAKIYHYLKRHLDW